MTVFLIILAAIIATLLGGLFAMKFKDKLHLIVGFSAGVLLGVSLFELLPESIELAKGLYDAQAISICIALGFVVYMLVDRLFSLHKHDDSNCDKPAHKGKLNAVAVVIHSMLDGLGIGLAFQVSDSIGWVVAFAVLVHKFSDGVIVVGAVLRSGSSHTIKWLVIAGLAPVVGVILSYYVIISDSILGLVLAFFIGLFVYISATDLIPESHHQHPTVWTTLSTIIGMLVIFAASRFTG